MALVYVLAVSLGVQTVQLVTGAISAISAVASASAAILIWRGNVQGRKTILIDRVLGPAYSEIRRTMELLESWKTEAKDLPLSTPFLKQVGSDWLYYTIDTKLRSELEAFQGLVPRLDEQRDLCKSVVTLIVTNAASAAFAQQNISVVYFWRSHSWSDGQVRGQNGRQPNWELIVDAPPFLSPPGYYVHSLQLVDFNNQEHFSLPLLTEAKEPMNRADFDKFWEHARGLASKDLAIVEFRKLWAEALQRCSALEGKLDSEIKHLR